MEGGERKRWKIQFGIETMKTLRLGAFLFHRAHGQLARINGFWVEIAVAEYGNKAWQEFDFQPWRTEEVERWSHTVAKK